MTINNISSSSTYTPILMEQVDNESAIYQTPPSTPPLRSYRHIVPIPATPLRSRVELGPIFKGRLPLNKVDKNPFEFEVPRFLYVEGSCFLPNGNEELCIKQPPQSKSCGAGAAVMILSHIILNKQKPIELNEKFWTKYSQVQNINQIDLIDWINSNTNITSFEYLFKGLYLHSKEHINNKIEKSESFVSYEIIDDYSDSPLERIADLQRKISTPVIVSITNKQIGGHWIVFDHIENRNIFIRDPFAGCAYKVSSIDFFENWAARDEIKIIYPERLKTVRKSSQCQLI